MKVFSKSFPKETFHQTVILGGGVGEYLGLPKEAREPDLLLNAIRETFPIPHLARTRMDVTRELLAFSPVG